MNIAYEFFQLLSLQIMQNARAFRRVTIRPKDVIMPFLVLLSLNVTLLLLWTALAPWRWQRINGVSVDSIGRTTETYGICTSDNKSLSKLFGILVGVVNIVPVILTNYQSYRARDLPSEFN